MNIKKGDEAQVLAGKDKGKKGTVAQVSLKEGKLTIEGVNLFKKRIRPKKQGEKGQTVLLPRPLSLSNAMLVCKACKKPSKTGVRIEGEKKIRFCKRCGAVT